MPGLVLIATKCIRPQDAPEWAAWYPGYVDSLIGGPVTEATAWTLDDAGEPGRPGPGHTHVTMLEVQGDPAAAVAAIDALVRDRRTDLDAGR